MAWFRRLKLWLVEWRHDPRVVWRRAQGPLYLTIEVSQWLPLLVVVVLLGWYIAAPSVAAALCLACITVLVAWSFYWALQVARGLRGQRDLRYAAMQVGDELEEQVSLQNRSSFPTLWVEVVDHTNMLGYQVSGVRGVGGTSNSSWRAHTICIQRGIFQLGPWELRSGDPLGIFLVRQVYTQRQEILVYPPLAALPPDLLPFRGKLGEHHPLRQPLQAETIDSMSVRDYLPGDPLHHIHWRTSARKEVPYVKVFQPQAASRVWVLPDLDPSALFGWGSDSSEETTVLLAASLAAQSLQDKLAVGVFAGGAPPIVALPQTGQVHLWSILDRLAPLHPQPGGSLTRTLGLFQPLMSQRDLLLIITTTLREEWVDSLRRMMRERGGVAVRVFLLDPVSFGGESSAESFLPMLVQAGMEGRVIRRGEIQPLVGAYGVLSRWEFVTFGTGRAVARQTPRRAASIFAGQRWSE
jgi:uncharacterized protein (DUF58 family)